MIIETNPCEDCDFSPEEAGMTLTEYLESINPSSKQEPCEDVISRQAAIDVVRKWFDKIQLNGDICLDGIVSLPSVTPQYTDAEIQKMQEMEQAEIQKAYKLGEASQPKIGHCKDCKHWKESDGTYRRDIYAESKCPMNCKEVYEGNGYCFLFESKAEDEDKV